AQAMVFLWRAAGMPAPSGEQAFTDVPETAYYHDAVLWAAEKGITSGTGTDTFSPDAPCQRGQIVTFLYRAFEE
ncbi:MAG: S-layer homology domain-containing protein, partial [Anaerotignum sp.]